MCQSDGSSFAYRWAGTKLQLVHQKGSGDMTAVMLVAALCMLLLRCSTGGCCAGLLRAYSKPGCDAAGKLTWLAHGH